MAEASSDLEGPDFEKGCDIDQVQDGGMLLGHAFGEAILVARQGHQLFAIGALPARITAGRWQKD